VVCVLATISAETSEHQVSSEEVDRIAGGYPVSKAQSKFVVSLSKKKGRKKERNSNLHSVFFQGNFQMDGQ